MKAMTVYLVPHSSFRGNRPPRSDTLFGAICWGYRLLFGVEKLEQRLAEFTKISVPFLVSSLFPYTTHHTSKIHFLPKPLADVTGLLQASLELSEFEKLRRRQQRQFIPDTEFSSIIQGEPFYDIGEHDIRHIQKFHVPRNSMNRLTGSIEHLFYTEEFSSRSETTAGLFFCLKYRADLENDLKTIIYFLGDKGIGGGSSVGKGHIQDVQFVDALPYEEPLDEESSYAITLSLTFPCTKMRAMLEHSWYDLEKRQGQVESMYVASESEHLRKDHLLLLKEGSTFPKSKGSYYGENRIVREDDGTLGFDVQHYGYAFTVNTLHLHLKTNEIRNQYLKLHPYRYGKENYSI